MSTPSFSRDLEWKAPENVSSKLDSSDCTSSVRLRKSQPRVPPLLRNTWQGDVCREGRPAELGPEPRLFIDLLFRIEPSSSPTERDPRSYSYSLVQLAGPLLSRTPTICQVPDLVPVHSIQRWLSESRSSETSYVAWVSDWPDCHVQTARRSFASLGLLL